MQAKANDYADSVVVHVKAQPPRDVSNQAPDSFFEPDKSLALYKASEAVASNSAAIEETLGLLSM